MVMIDLLAMNQLLDQRLVSHQLLDRHPGCLEVQGARHPSHLHRASAGNHLDISGPLRPPWHQGLYW